MALPPAVANGNAGGVLALAHGGPHPNPARNAGRAVKRERTAVALHMSNPLTVSSQEVGEQAVFALQQVSAAMPAGPAVLPAGW